MVEALNMMDHDGEPSRCGAQLDIGNLDSSIDESDLVHLGSRVASVVKAWIVKPGDAQRRGYGFIEYRNAVDAERAIKELDQYSYKDSRIRANIAKYDTNRYQKTLKGENASRSGGSDPQQPRKPAPSAGSNALDGDLTRPRFNLAAGGDTEVREAMDEGNANVENCDNHPVDNGRNANDCATNGAGEENPSSQPSAPKPSPSINSEQLKTAIAAHMRMADSSSSQRDSGQHEAELDDKSLRRGASDPSSYRHHRPYSPGQDKDKDKDSQRGLASQRLRGREEYSGRSTGASGPKSSYHEKDRSRDRDREKDRDRERDRDLARDRDRDLARDRDRDLARDRDRDLARDRDRDRGRDERTSWRDRDRDRREFPSDRHVRSLSRGRNRSRSPSAGRSRDAGRPNEHEIADRNRGMDVKRSSPDGAPPQAPAVKDDYAVPPPIAPIPMNAPAVDPWFYREPRIIYIDPRMAYAPDAAVRGADGAPMAAAGLGPGPYPGLGVPPGHMLLARGPSDEYYYAQTHPQQIDYRPKMDMYPMGPGPMPMPMPMSMPLMMRDPYYVGYGAVVSSNTTSYQPFTGSGSGSAANAGAGAGPGGAPSATDASAGHGHGQAASKPNPRSMENGYYASSDDRR